MWKQKIAALWPEAAFQEPAAPGEIEAAQLDIGVRFSDELTALLRECDGFSARFGTSFVWRASPQARPHESIAAQNRTMRSTPDFAELYAPFDDLLFIGEDGGGNLFALRAENGEAGREVVLWNHEDDSREVVSDGGLAGYLAFAAQMDQG